MRYFVILFFLGLIYFSCNPDNAVSTNGQTGSSVYNKIYTIDSGNVKFEVWSATGGNLIFGYNDLGLKVYINGTEMKTGFAKLKPMMNHGGGINGHSAPTSTLFLYDNINNLFTGYVCFTMITDSTSRWTGYYNYNNQYHLDSVPFVIYSLPSGQQNYWDDIDGGHTYVLTLITPKTPKLGINDFECILHRTNDDNNFIEINSANMVIKPWMPAHGHGSSSNVNPISIGAGRYSGKVNFTMQGNWYLYDTIRINDTLISKIPPPKFNFDVQ